VAHLALLVAVAQDIMRMVEKEIAGLEVEVREEKQAAAEQEATSSAIASDLLLAAGEGSSASSYTKMASLLLGSPPDETVVSSTQQSENEQQMNEIFDFLHKKLADSGLARSRMSLPVAMPTMPPPVCNPAPITDALKPEPTLPPPTSASGVAVFHTIPDVADLPPPLEEDDGADYYDVDEQPENQKINNIFSKLQQKLANEGIKTIPPTPRFVSSAEQAVVTELVGSGECEDLQPLCAQATLPSPPSIEMLPSPRLMALSLRRGLAGSSLSGLAAVSIHLYHARLLPSRQQEQADADAIAGPRPPPSARGGRLDMCARCARHIPDDQPRLLALGRVYHQPCLTCTGTVLSLPRSGEQRSVWGLIACGGAWTQGAGGCWSASSTPRRRRPTAASAPATPARSRGKLRHRCPHRYQTLRHDDGHSPGTRKCKYTPIQSPIFNSLAVTSNGEPNVLRSSHCAQESTRDCCQRRDVVWLCPWVLGAHATR
jgi:hypothetical protein